MGLEWIGILMGAFSILYILSLFSYSTADPPLNSNNLENGYNNMIGPVGAYLAYISFITIGFAAYMMPLLLLLFGLSFLHPFFYYLRKSWREPAAAFIYILALIGLLQVLNLKFGITFWAEGWSKWIFVIFRVGSVWIPVTPSIFSSAAFKAGAISDSVDSSRVSPERV